MNLNKHHVAILGAGNLGCSIAEGLYASGTFSADSIYLTRRRIEKLDPYKEKGFQVTADNNQAVTRSSILLICVEPHQLDQLLEEIRETVDPAEQIVISVVSGAEVGEIKKKLPAGTPVVRAMPNTAISIRESMTCICQMKRTVQPLKSPHRSLTQ